MILVDTSVWISHFRYGVPALERALSEGVVLCHPFIIGELACGQLKHRQEILTRLSTLPQAPMAELDEILHFIDRRHLANSGIGLIDAHLLASAALASEPLWTLDKKLLHEAIKAHLNYDSPLE